LLLTLLSREHTTAEFVCALCSVTVYSSLLFGGFFGR
jgi:hypothetical protein